MLRPDSPALVLAPMEGITDAPMRDLQGETGAFTYAVSEFMRVSNEPIPAKVFRRDVPELNVGARTPSGLPVQVQLLGGDPERMAVSAMTAVRAGATAIDINFGCPAPTVNRHDGGASLLRHPHRIREVVRAVRDALPADIPVSAKLRLGWDNIEDVDENTAMAAEGGAAWLTIHARTRTQGYAPPVYWQPIGRVRERLGLPVIANGDIWTIQDFKKCQTETGCIHFMIGRSALSNPGLPAEIARELNLGAELAPTKTWECLFLDLIEKMGDQPSPGTPRSLSRLKQWAKLAHSFGHFPGFDTIKLARSVPEFLELMSRAHTASSK